MEENCYPISDYFLYSIAHPNKTGVPLFDLSKDPEATVSNENLTPVQLLTERVITKVFTHYSIPLDITDSIRATFRTKLWRMGRNLSTMGGTKRKQQLQEWRASIWSLKIESREVLRQLHKRARQTEHQLECETLKRHKAEEDVKSLKSELKKLEKTRDENSKTIKRLRTGKSEKSRSRSKKSWDSYSRQHQSVIKTSLAGDIKNATCFLNQHFQPVTVELVNKDTGKKEYLDVEKGTFSSHSDKLTDTDEKLKYTLFVKEKFSLSDEAYHELSMIYSDLPRIHQMKTASKMLDESSEISILPEHVVQQSFERRLRILLEKNHTILSVDKPLKVKLSGDGTKVSRSLHVVNFTFTLVDTPTATSVAGNHTIAILKTAESYENLASGLANIAEEISTG